MTWDGRLDRRGELIRSLGIRTPGPCSDAELVARAYDRWGEDFPRHLEGDFALALWDGRRKRLLLARDPFAVRPLFYTVADGTLLWASRLAAVRGAAQLSAEIDEEWVAGYLTSSIDPVTTPFLKIRAVPPGHTLVVGTGSLRTRRFWHLPAETLPGGRHAASDGEIEERFRELFVDAVGCRLASDGPVAVDLSGGLDASSVVCVAGDLLRRDVAAAPDLIPVSQIYERSPCEAEQRSLLRQVEEAVGRPGRYITEAEAPLLDALERPIYELPTPLAGFQQRHRRLLEILREHGSRVLLSGLAGDHLLSGQRVLPLELADRLRRGHLGGFAAALRRWRTTVGTSYPRLLWRSLLLPFLPLPLRRRLTDPPLRPPEWLDPGFDRRLGIAGRLARLAEGSEPGRFRLPGQRARAASLEAAIRKIAWLYDTGPEPIEVRYPFLDRRLVEFCLALADDQILRPGETPCLRLRALAPHLPPGLLTRRDGRGPDEAVLRTVGEAWRELEPLLTEPRVARRGWVDATRLRRTLLEARFGRPTENPSQLVAVLALEGWLRRLEREVSTGRSIPSPGCHDPTTRVPRTERGCP